METKRELLIEEIEKIPEDLLEEVLVFVEFIKYKHDKVQTHLASEQTLSKDWLSKEEDEAWQDL